MYYIHIVIISLKLLITIIHNNWRLPLTFYSSLPLEGGSISLFWLSDNFPPFPLIQRMMKRQKAFLNIMSECLCLHISLCGHPVNNWWDKVSLLLYLWSLLLLSCVKVKWVHLPPMNVFNFFHLYKSPPNCKQDRFSIWQILLSDSKDLCSVK